MELSNPQLTNRTKRCFHKGFSHPDNLLTNPDNKYKNKSNRIGKNTDKRVRGGSVIS